MCKTGQVESAYSIARLDYEAHPDNVWTQIGLGWALYYKIREAVAGKSLYSLVANLKELSELDLLSGEHGKMICTNVAWKLADYVKALPPGNNSDADSLFDVFRNLKFGPSSGYSYLLSVYLKLENWEGLQNFIEWWNLDNLQAEDYQQFKMQNGRQMISLAERAYIGYAKALLRSGDKWLADAFIPKLEALAESHSEMTYPGYFCGKLMISAGASREDALTAVVPFVRKKKRSSGHGSCLRMYSKTSLTIGLPACCGLCIARLKRSFLARCVWRWLWHILTGTTLLVRNIIWIFRCGAILGMDGVCLVRLMTGCVNRGCVRLWRMAVTALSGCT